MSKNETDEMGTCQECFGPCPKGERFCSDYCEKKYDVELVAPDLATLEEWMADGGCEAVDGCWVEMDGTCPHGCPSWLIEMGLI